MPRVARGTARETAGQVVLCLARTAATVRAVPANIRVFVRLFGVDIIVSVVATMMSLMGRSPASTVVFCGYLEH